jgi:hypothetical protein
MPITPTYPGVYIEEIPSGVRTITPVATSITAFVGRAKRGPTNEPVTITSLADFERKFGGLASDSSMSYAVAQYYLNGGSQAVIVRVAGAGAAFATGDVNGLPLRATGEGVWGAQIRAHVSKKTKDPNNAQLFNLFLYDDETNALEEFRNVSTDPNDPRFIKDVLEDQSKLAEVDPGQQVPADAPGEHGEPANGEWFDGGPFTQFGGGNDGGPLADADIRGQPAGKTGIYALEKADLFNLLCLAPPQRGQSSADIETDTWVAALNYCVSRRAMLLVDPPSGWNSIDAARIGIEQLRGPMGGEQLTRNGVLFFPRLKMADALREGRSAEFVPCGAIAGICARTDVARGVWKSPAGISAGIAGVREFTVTMTDPENGLLNPLGVNCLRSFRVHGNVVWGSRTLAGADEQGSEWKYLAVRRFTLFLEESLYRGTQWVVFEPNDEPLWSQIRLNIGTFMQDLFRQGAFQGTTPKEAYFVKCDSETTQQSDIDRGIVNIEVGFAPLKPAEFVILKFQQMTKRDN